MTTEDCPCEVPHTAPLEIPAGLNHIPRQIGAFPEFLRAMLAEIDDKEELAGWRARGEQDLGRMLLEMWALVCDISAFYDQVIAHESYLRTAHRRRSVRLLTEVLGYLPRPAVGAGVELALSAAPRTSPALPAGTAFRSGAFGDEPPQVFELDHDTAIDSRNNQWTLDGPRPTHAGQGGAPGPSTDTIYVDPDSLGVEVGDPVLVERGAATGRPRTVVAIEDVEFPSGEVLTQVTLDDSVTFYGDLGGHRLLRPVRTVPLWTRDATYPTALPIWYHGASSSYSYLWLDAEYREFRAGQTILVERTGEPVRRFVIDKVETQDITIDAGTSTSTDGPDYSATVKVPMTRLQTDLGINHTSRLRGGTDWQDEDGPEIVVHGIFTPAGQVMAPASVEVADTDTLVLAGRMPSEPLTGSFGLLDADGRSVVVTGTLEPTTSTLILDPEQGWSPALRAPVTVYGNVRQATRGESILLEVLGDGDPTQGNQTFELGKSPLTYLLDGAEARSTLKVYVDSQQWTEQRSFYGAGPADRVFIVRHDDEGGTSIIFGDGIRGARLPRGSANVLASYRHGAGAASPPAGSIGQIAKPVDGLASVMQPLAAGGGADQESMDDIRELGPRSALVLGRAVSIRDYHAIAAGLPGVRAAACEWRWSGLRQRPVVQSWTVGDLPAASVLEALIAAGDPSVPIDAEDATAVPVSVQLELLLDPDVLVQPTLDAVSEVLIGEDGLLRVERLGIGETLFRSVLVGEVLAVEGTVAVRNILWNGEILEGIGVNPGTGAWFEITEVTLGT